MSKKEIINTLRKNAKLEKREDALHFDETLAKLAEIELSKLDIIELMMILDDNNPHQEVLWGLLHFIESVDSEIFIQALFECTQKLLKKAPEWTQLFYIRLLNNQEARSMLKTMLLNEQSSNFNVISQIIREVSINESAPLSDYANSVIK
ncbi:MAG: hypothetical protein KI793_33520 [Rivularia sp. (in: Bacteria)]|nr:hypothetical protein [Rivularia sp. MS3]